MTTIEILPIADANGVKSYRAILRGGETSSAEEKQFVGKTAGQALDALTAQIEQAEFSALLVIQNATPDLLFTAEQQEKLATLMEQWRAARDKGEELASEQQDELDALIEAELAAATARTRSLMQ